MAESEFLRPYQGLRTQARKGNRRELFRILKETAPNFAHYAGKPAVEQLIECLKNGIALATKSLGAL